MPKPIYFNKKQIEFIEARQPIRALIAGRGFGKSTVIGGSTYRKLKALPKAKGFFSSTTYNQILTKTLPAIEQKWNEFGLKEDIHYVVGRRPPKNFTRPYSVPRKFENVITFFNGFTIEFLSMDRPDLARGGSYDFGEIDEWALIKQEHFNKVILPSIRGNRHYFSSWQHQQVSGYSSIPWKPAGYWILDYEEKAKAFPEEYFYLEATALDNIDILGEKGIERMRRELGYLEFQVEVMNKRIKKVEDGFYHRFDEEKHTYTPAFAYGIGERGIITRGAKDYDAKALIDLSFDFSGWFNCMTVWQEKNNIERCLSQLYVKQESILNLVDQFCEKYKQHQMKFVRCWGEPRGHDKRAEGETIYIKIAKRFKALGWDCQIKASAGRTTNHLDRYEFINEVLGETKKNLPKIRINADHCKDVIIAVQVTEVTNDFKKDKSKEKDRTFNQAHAPHFTDTIDYYFQQKHNWRVNNLSLQIPGTANFI